MTDPQIEALQLRLGTAEGQLQARERDYNSLYRFVESLNSEVQKLRVADPFLGTDTIRDERDSLAQWKREQLTVKAWWYEIDTYVRNHRSVLIGDSVAAATLRLLRERDALAGVLPSIHEAMLRLNALPSPILNLTHPCPIF